MLPTFSTQNIGEEQGVDRMKKIECVFPTHQLQEFQDALVNDSWQSVSVLNVYDGNTTDLQDIGPSRGFPTKCRFELLVEDDAIHDLTQTIQRLTSKECIELMVTNVDSSLMILAGTPTDRDEPSQRSRLA